jgi:hypothetical protein
MVNFGEAQVFEWKMTQPFNGFIWRQLFFSNLIKQLMKAFRIHVAFRDQL